jgi:two-component system nitrate/nitrite response regulator NarL
MRRRTFPTALVGPNILFRDGIARILKTTDFRVIASGPHVDNFALPPQCGPILLLIDAVDDMCEAVGEISLFKEQHPAGNVAILANHCRPNDMVAAYRAGANAYLGKSVTPDAFVKVLELVMLGETIVPRQLLALIGTESASLPNVNPSVCSDVDSTFRLSAREKCILRHIVDGNPNKIIARKTEISEATVKVHVKAILRKIGVRNRTQAAIWAVNHNYAVNVSAHIASASAIPLLIQNDEIESAYMARVINKSKF